MLVLVYRKYCQFSTHVAVDHSPVLSYVDLHAYLSLCDDCSRIDDVVSACTVFVPVHFVLQEPFHRPWPLVWRVYYHPYAPSILEFHFRFEVLPVTFLFLLPMPPAVLPMLFDVLPLASKDSVAVAALPQFVHRFQFPINYSVLLTVRAFQVDDFQVDVFLRVL